MSTVIRLPSDLKHHLRAFRAVVGLSQGELGERLGGLSQRRVAAIESAPEKVSVGQLLDVLHGLGLEMVIRPADAKGAGQGSSADGVEW